MVFITRTGGHTSRESLTTCLERFRGAERAMTQNRGYRAAKDAYGFVGTITVLEVTYKATSGWHVHTHTLGFLDRPAADITALRADLFAAWLVGANKVGLQVSCDAFKVQATYGAVEDYMSKYGDLPKGRAWGPEDEMTKGHVKLGRVEGTYLPFDLAAAADRGLQARFVEYARAFVGRRRLVFSDGLLARLVPGEVDASDDDLASKPDESWEFFDYFDEEQLKAAAYTGQRDEWLQLVGLGDTVAARAFVDELVTRYRFMMQGHVVRDEVGEARVLARTAGHKDWLVTMSDLVGAKEGSPDVDRELRNDRLEAVERVKDADD